MIYATYYSSSSTVKQKELLYLRTACLFDTCARNTKSAVLSPLRRYWCRRHASNLFYEKLSLVDKLFVISPILQEMRQKRQKLLAIHEQNLLNGN